MKRKIPEEIIKQAPHYRAMNFNPAEYTGAPEFLSEYNCGYELTGVVIKKVYEVLDKIPDQYLKHPPVRDYWLIINTEGELEVIYKFHNEWHKSFLMENRW